MMARLSLVSVVDDDESVRESLPDLLWQLGFASQAFSSAEAFLTSDRSSAKRAVCSSTSRCPACRGPNCNRN